LYDLLFMAHFVFIAYLLSFGICCMPSTCLTQPLAAEQRDEYIRHAFHTTIAILEVPSFNLLSLELPCITTVQLYATVSKSPETSELLKWRDI
jgi:hypothetical protein